MRKPEVRRPVVAGQFYPSSPQRLKIEIEKLIKKDASKTDALACMLPHAGYMYSGRVAAETVSHITVKDTVILLGPNHTGNGSPFSIMIDGVWETPLGEVTIDSGLAQAIRKGSRLLEEDSLAHRLEHSLEVELPFLQYFRSDFKIVPIAFLSDDLRSLKQAGQEIAAAIIECGVKETVIIVASSDMTHYESLEDTHRKDQQAIEAILELNEDKLAERIWRLHISMCGYAPVIAMLSAVKQLGARMATLVKYETSGDVTGDTESVVGYAGIIIS